MKANAIAKETPKKKKHNIVMEMQNKRNVTN
jgi:hypothetical protein